MRFYMDEKSKRAKGRAREFLKICSEFKLGALPTEKPHPLTRKLSEIAKTDLKEAISILKGIDIDAIKVLETKIEAIEELKSCIEATMKSGGRIFLCGCGSTGRLSLSLEVLWRQVAVDKNLAEAVVSFMAGGDTAIIKAIEDFEDHPGFAMRQLEELKFDKNDLLIASTEGGETPFVIGAVEAALKISERAPWFLYCNPDDILIENAERSRKMILNKSVKKINLYVGPMALSGSTRMQASTVLMLAVGLPLMGAIQRIDFRAEIKNFEKFINSLDFLFLENFIVEESEIYKNGGYLIYETDEYGITLLTDTTERAPTFSLNPYENINDIDILPSLSYLSISGIDDVKEAWEKLLGRPPRVLGWKEYSQTGIDYLYGFDLGSGAFDRREKLLKGASLHQFGIYKDVDKMSFVLGDFKHELYTGELNLLFEHITLKILLNIHSTLVMGRLGRYRDNLMIMVKPGNNKLIDRAIRYVIELINRDKQETVSYEEVAYKLFEEMETLKENESIILKTFEAIKS